MKIQFDEPENTSRRKFAKSISAAFVTAPLSFLLVNAQNQRAKKTPPPSAADGRQKDETRVITRHNPPIIFDSSSLVVAVPGKQLSGPQPINEEDRRFKYRHEDANNITKVVIVRYNDETGDVDDPIPFRPRRGLQAKLWLQNLKEGKSGYEPIKGNAQVLFRGGIGGGLYEIESYKAFELEPSLDPVRPHRYRYPGDGLHFRIGRIEIERPGNRLWTYETPPNIKYKIYVTTDHPPHSRPKVGG